MTITIPLAAPPWAAQLTDDIQNELEEKTVTRLGGKAYAIGDLPDPAQFRHKQVFLSDGASNRPAAVSAGTRWRDRDGTAV